MAAKKDPGLPVPATADQIPRGSPFSVFVPGLAAFENARGSVQIAPREGDSISGRLVASDAGRLCTLAQRHMMSSLQVLLTGQGPTGYLGADVAFYEALEAAFGTEAVHPLATYSVVVVIVDPA